MGTTYRYDITGHSCNTAAGGNDHAWIAGDGETLLLIATDAGVSGATVVDDSTHYVDMARVMFDEGLDSSYAEYVLGNHDLEIVTKVGSSPPQYLVRPTGGVSSGVLSVELMDEADIYWSRPEER